MAPQECLDEDVLMSIALEAARSSELHSLVPLSSHLARLTMHIFQCSCVIPQRIALTLSPSVRLHCCSPPELHHDQLTAQCLQVGCMAPENVETKKGYDKQRAQAHLCRPHCQVPRVAIPTQVSMHS